jgi:membrane protease subunit (stomatin/prohibitin family)
MGLIKSGFSSTSSTLQDSYLDYIMCQDMSGGELVKLGTRANDRHSSNKGNPHIITDGSGIAIGSGQCALMIEDGKVIDFCAEAGKYIWDTGSEPSVMHSGFGGLKEMSHTIKERFKHGGYTGKTHMVYYVNTTNIGGNKVGKGDIPFRDVEFNLTAKLKCFGTYEYKINNPVHFFETHVGFAGLGEDGYFTRDEIDNRLRPAVLQSLEPAFAQLSLKRISVELIGLSTKELSAAITEELGEEWQVKRGIEICDMKVSITVDEKSMDRIAKFQDARVMSNVDMARGRMTEATAGAMQSAASNTNGAMAGFMGMNMAQMTGGQQQTPQQAPQTIPLHGTEPQAPQTSQQASPGQDSTLKQSWHCTACHAENTGKFCMECGAKQPTPPPVSASWTCPQCQMPVSGNFCTECGMKKPKDLDASCETCGYESDTPFKFCPQCGAENIE